MTLRWIVVRVALLGVGAALILLLIRLITTGDVRLADDFVVFWAPGRLVLTNQNPFDLAAVHALQTAAGRSAEARTLPMYNPPWTLALVVAFALPSYPAGRLLWLLASLSLVLVSAGWLWRLYGGPDRYRWVALVMSVLFVPALFSLVLGQITPFMLVGIPGFLYYQRRRADLTAGAFVALLTIKPQLTYLVLLAVILWVVDQRRWRILVGIGLVVGVAAGLSLLLSPALISQYLDSIAQTSPMVWATPTLGGMLRHILGPERYWLQFLPVILGLLWLVVYWRLNRKRWWWTERMSLLLLVSLATTAFGWEYDLVLLLPPVLQVAVWVLVSEEDKYTRIVVLTYVAVNVLAVILAVASARPLWYTWLTPALLIWYLSARQMLQRTSSTPAPVPFEAA